MRSIRARLTGYLLGGIGLLIVAAGIVLEVNIARWLEREFDRTLEAKARALATLTKQEQGEVELDFADEFMPEFESSADPHYFELWLDGETLLERSNSFNTDPKRSNSQLPREPDLAPATRFADTALPDGRPGRWVRIDFVPQIESENDIPAPPEEQLPAEEPILDPTQVTPGSRFHTATVLIARERQTLDAQIARLRWSFVAFIGLLLGTVAALISISLKIGLRPLNRLARQVHDLEAESLDRRVDLGSPPRELAPVVNQLNELLVRLERAFDRERRLTSDIAHELKTPIAELRSLCEVGARWPDDPIAAQKFFEDAWAISLQMERVVVHLLALARFDEGAEQVRMQQVDVSEVLSAAWRPLEKLALEKGLVLGNRVPLDALLETDREKLQSILSNLLSNAVDYSRPGTEITCHFEASNRVSSLTVSNHALGLDHNDLAVMFERFWRKDAARSGGRNVGLGLAIVRAFSDLLGFELETELAADKQLRITLSKAH